MRVREFLIKSFMVPEAVPSYHQDVAKQNPFSVMLHVLRQKLGPSLLVSQELKDIRLPVVDRVLY